MNIFLLSAGIILASFGFAALGLSQAQHWRAVRRESTSGAPGWLRPAGWVLVAASGVPPVIRDGVAFGGLLWIGLLSVAAVCIVAIRVWRAKIS